MLVKEIMTRNVECVRPGDTLDVAARKMRDLDIGPLPVCDNDRLTGMVTDRDITIRATAEGLDPKAATVREVMTPDISYCYEDQDVRDAADTMAAQQIRRLAVLNRDKRLVGIVSLGDIAVESGDRAQAADTVRAVSEPAAPRR